MPNIHKINFLNEVEERFGKLKKLPNSQSLFDLPNNSARLYIRYSKVHNKNLSFYGLRTDDLKLLEGHNSFICFIWDSQVEPIFLPFPEFEDVFNNLLPAKDGQYKVQIYHEEGQNELYIANAGRFNIESFFTWEYFKEQVDKSKIVNLPEFSHSQIQTLIGSIGIMKGFDVWIPNVDRKKLDWEITPKFEFLNSLPIRYEKVNRVIKEIDVIWVRKG
ncbi:MAG: hypothetical protein ACMZ7B_13905 [Balneola sp.]